MDEKEVDNVVYVRLPAGIARKLDRRVARERRALGADVPASTITRSSVIRSAVVRMLEDEK